MSRPKMSKEDLWTQITGIGSRRAELTGLYKI